MIMHEMIFSVIILGHFNLSFLMLILYPYIRLVIKPHISKSHFLMSKTILGTLPIDKLTKLFGRCPFFNTRHCVYILYKIFSVLFPRGLSDHYLVYLLIIFLQLSFDLLESWLADNPGAIGLKSTSGESLFKDLALFQDYHGLSAFKNVSFKQYI